MKSLILTGVIAVSIQAQSAMDSFDIADYRQPTFHSQGLSLIPQASFRTMASPSGGTQEGNMIDGYGGASGSHWIRLHSSNREYYGEHSLRGHYSDLAYKDITRSPGSTYGHSSTGGTQSLGYGIVIHESGRWYPAGLFFLGGLFQGVMMNQPMSNSHSNSEQHLPQQLSGTTDIHIQNSDHSSTSGNQNILLELNAGVGGISDVTGATIALHMLKKTKIVIRQNVLIDRQGIQKFASMIETLKRRHFLDSREKRIDDIDSLYRWMLQTEIVGKENTRLTMELLDIWEYGFDQTRLSGFEFKIKPMGSISREQTEETNTTRELDTTINTTTPEFGFYAPNRTTSSNHSRSRINGAYGLGLGIYYEKPINHIIQASAGLSMQGSIQTTNLDQTTTYSASPSYVSRSQSTQPIFSTLGSTAITWFPTMRTTIKTGTRLLYSRSFKYLSYRTIDTIGTSWKDVNKWADHRKAIVGFDASIRYYVSPSISLYLVGNADYLSEYADESNSYDYKRWTFGGSTAMQWQLF